MKIPALKIPLKLNAGFPVDQKTLILFALLALFFIYADYRYIFSPQKKGIRVSGDSIIQKQEELELLKGALPRLNELANKEKQAQATVFNFSMKFTAEEEIVSLLQHISEIGDKYRVTISEIKPSRQAAGQHSGTEAEGVPGQTLLITLSALCDYHSLGKFLNELECMDTYIAVENFKITPQQTDSLVQKVQLVLKTYVE